MSKQQPRGYIDQTSLGRNDDYLYRISIKGLIKNEAGEVLVVKETGRTWWDLPGGGMNHGENIKSAIAREMAEEVNLSGDFTYQVIDVDNPAYLPNADVLQVRLIYRVFPKIVKFTKGIDADNVSFINPDLFKNSDNLIERRIYEYANRASFVDPSS